MPAPSKTTTAPAFYRPMAIELLTHQAFRAGVPIQAVVYACPGVEKIMAVNETNVKAHLQELKNSTGADLLHVAGAHTQAFLIVLWAEEPYVPAQPAVTNIMTDVWSFARLEHGVQAQFNITTFRNTQPCADAGSGAVAGIQLFALETAAMLRAGSPEAWLRGPRPQSGLVEKAPILDRVAKTLEDIDRLS